MSDDIKFPPCNQELHSRGSRTAAMIRSQGPAAVDMGDIAALARAYEELLRVFGAVYQLQLYAGSMPMPRI